MRRTTLDALGCDDRRREEIHQFSPDGVPGRVARVEHGTASLLTDHGPRRVDTTKAEPLIVGDWVVVEPDRVVRLERRNELCRRMGVHRDERKALAANVDVVLVVYALDGGLHLDRLMSFVVIAYDSGATPIVVLTKSDLHADAEAALVTVEGGLVGVETVVVSTKTGDGLDALRQRIDGRTIVLLGESGAGKSTLTNALCGEELLATGEVRANGQGRHTTTHRELIPIPSGGVIIDTPGIRVVASFGDGGGVNRAFDDVVTVASECRFADCAHGTTPGCAVARAVADGTLDQLRVEAYEREQREREYLERRLSQRERSTERKGGVQRRKQPDPTLGDVS